MRQYELEHEFEKLLTKTRQTSSMYIIIIIIIYCIIIIIIIVMKNVEIDRKGERRTATGATGITLPGRKSCLPSPVKSNNTSTTHCTPPPPPIAAKKDPLDLTIQTLSPSTFQSMSITEPREGGGDKKGRDPNKDEEEEGPSLTILTIRPPKDTTATSSTSQCMCTSACLYFINCGFLLYSY